MAEATQVAAGTRPQHPLEPLTPDEITAAVELLKGRLEKVPSNAQFLMSMNLD